ncbi:MAG: hypothetical protein ACK42D_03670 [Candidatus Paceibacteria bacterium]
MEIIIILLTILFNIALSLGIGSSTLVIVNFCVAIADGKINADERRMMGVAYVVLRIALVLLLATSLLLMSLNVQESGLATYSPFVIAIWTLLFVLYFNAVLMTLQVMPSAFGPSIQAGTWYTFGIITSLSYLGIFFSVTQFIIVYISFVLFVTVLVNGVIMYLDYLRTRGVASTASKNKSDKKKDK